jgi:hypothetical protein
MADYTSPTEAYLLTWLVPGLGHHRLGMKRRGRFYFILLVLLFVVGQVLARGGAVTPSEHPFYFWLGQWWCGGVAILGLLLNWIVGGGGARFETYEIGQLYVTSAAVLNVLVLVDLFHRVESPKGIKDQ